MHCRDWRRRSGNDIAKIGILRTKVGDAAQVDDSGVGSGLCADFTQRGAMAKGILLG